MASHSRKKLDLAGQRYGKLIVIGPAANIGDRTAWLCKCDCGSEATVKTNRLRSGRTKDCGCVSGRPCQGLGMLPAGAAGRASLTYINGTCVEMLRAATVRKNNTSGVPGVDWLARKQRWRASICFKGRRYYLGSYKDFDDAVRARRAGEEKFHKAFLESVAGRRMEAVTYRGPIAGRPAADVASLLAASGRPDVEGCLASLRADEFVLAYEGGVLVGLLRCREEPWDLDPRGRTFRAMAPVVRPGRDRLGVVRVLYGALLSGRDRIGRTYVTDVVAGDGRYLSLLSSLGFREYCRMGPTEGGSRVVRLALGISGVSR